MKRDWASAVFDVILSEINIALIFVMYIDGELGYKFFDRNSNFYIL